MVKNKYKSRIWARTGVCTYGMVLAKIGCAFKNVLKSLKVKNGAMLNTRSQYA
jgi:hypothetical protein